MQGEWLKQPESGAVVIFVHGILSSGETCWRHESGTYWPELLGKEVSLGSLGVYVFTYQTGVFSGSYRVGDVVDAIKEHMRLDGVFENDQLIFVCHSMGGIVVRKYLVERAIDLIDARKKIGLFLVASPSLGADYADWFSFLARFMGHSQADALRFVRGNDWLKDLDKEFTNLKEGAKLSMKGKELVEDKFITLSGLWRKQVVEPFSGARYFGEPFKVAGSNHFSIAKPIDSEAIQHRLLCRFLAESFHRPARPLATQIHHRGPTAPDNQRIGRPVTPAALEGTSRILLGIALDTSGSMQQSIRNRSSGDISRFDSVTAALADLGSQVRAEVSRRSADTSSDFHVFVYGFGLRIGDGVSDLASLWKATQAIDLEKEVQTRKTEYENEGRRRAAAYSDLASLARSYGFGGLVASVTQAAVQSARQQIVADIGAKVLSCAQQIGNSTLTAQELAHLFDSSSSSSNADLIEHVIFGSTPMVAAANEIFGRFSRINRASYEQRTLLVVSDGAPTDGDPRSAFAAIRDLGVDVIACFVTDADIADPRILVGSPLPSWPGEAQLMWEIASSLDESSPAHRYLSAHGWRVERNAKLFVQVNHSDVLREFLRVAGCNISTDASSVLPQGS